MAAKKGTKARMARKPGKSSVGRWSMKSDRQLIELAPSRTLEAIAIRFKRSPATILKKAARLGLTIKRDKTKRK
jgi:hypothetical protein